MGGAARALSGRKSTDSGHQLFFEGICARTDGRNRIHSIYDFIENVLGMQIITSKRRITVEHATVRDEKLLDMDGYDCVAVVVNQTFNSDGLLFEYTQSRHQPDYFCFQDIATRKKS